MKRIALVLIAGLTASVSLTACSSEAGFVANSHVNIAEVGTFTTLNSDVIGETENKIATDLNVLTNQEFYNVDENGQLVANKAFGTVSVTSNSPFTVTYTLAKDATWSDGKAVEANDLALAVIAAKNSDFHSAHQTSSLATAEFAQAPTDGAKSITLKFANPIADWKTALSVRVPAHVVAAAAGVSSVISAFAANDLNKLAESYSTTFAAGSAAKNFATDGAYKINSVSAEKIELVAVRNYKGWHAGIVDKIALNVYPDNASAFKALSSGTADLLAPQVTLNEPASDLISQSQALGSAKFNVVTGDTDQSEAFVMNLGSGIFADATHMDPKLAGVLRQAFMSIVPKARAIDFASLAQVVRSSDSFVYGTFSKNYSGVVSSNGSANFQFQDVEKSAETLAAKKLPRAPMVRVLFDSNNPAAVSEWTMLSDHASSAGFNLTNISTTDPSAILATGEYDVYLGPTQLIGVGVGSVQQLANGPSRMLASQFSELTKDSLTSATDEALQALDKKLFELGFGLPMYQIPSLLVYNKRISGLKADPYGTSATWGYWTWQVSADK